jgi:hypothetical protein
VNARCTPRARTHAHAHHTTSTPVGANLLVAASLFAQCLLPHHTTTCCVDCSAVTPVPPLDLRAHFLALHHGHPRPALAHQPQASSWLPFPSSSSPSLRRWPAFRRAEINRSATSLYALHAYDLTTLARAAPTHSHPLTMRAQQVRALIPTTTAATLFSASFHVL